ncbi:very-long-chain 3-oxoacyl-CoA reductase-B-like [Bufo bufo]|uniref:very-long-chain 3-oxoacyl-CoA reductase-B-like n=1 Tax=Bufo bufo TaxID=8384 RepID=UPI001ABDA9EE|nr:very-long-chain 3-oxoacyl-CoA reductase-B-like [Bufo bufo]
MEESQFYRWLHLLGLLALSYLVLKQVWTMLIGMKTHILSRWWKTNLKKKYGGWAVVTGASNGIGKAYAKELARRGFDVVLISRSVEKLQNVADEIEKESQQKTKIIEVDFTEGTEIYPKVEKALKDLDIGILVVTGASNGIGKAYAKELARRGFDVVLISRSVEKLQNVADEIEKESQQKTKIIEVDFTEGTEIYPKVEKALKDLDIGILVNNIGISYYPGARRFLEVPDVNKGISDIMNCNVLSMVHMTRIVLPRMVERKKGLIINISSAAGARPYPSLTMYCATKAFMDFFSRSLYYEYRSDGITVQSIMPHLVSTNMNFNMKTNIMVKTSDDFAREALNTVGYSHRNNGCLIHSFQDYILDQLLTETFMNSQICLFIGGYALRILFKMLMRNKSQ